MIPTETILMLVKLSQEHQLEEISLTTPEGKFTVCRSEVASFSQLPVEVLQVPPVPVSETSAAADRNLVKVVSPLMGVFYSAPSPFSAPFQEVGDFVEKGETLCIIEAMKVMNEIVSEVSGTIEKILPKNGDVVESGGVLFLIRTAPQQ